MKEVNFIKLKKLNKTCFNGLSHKFKKPLYRITMTVFVSFMALSNITIPAHAETVTITEDTDFSDTEHAFEMQGPVYDGGKRVSFHTGGWTALKANGEYVFCVEPWKTVDPGTVVNEADLQIMLNNDYALSKKLSQIGYFGYHNTSKTRADYVTTQMMIWEARGWTVTRKPSYYDSKKAAVLDKIERSAKTLSFSGTTKTVKVNETVSFTDTNDVLSDYMKAAGYPNQNTDYNVDGVTLRWSANTLYLTPTINAKDTFSFTSYVVDNAFVGTPIVYYNGNQQMTSPLNRLYDPAISWLDLNIQKQGKIRIVKHDQATGKVVKQSGIAFDIYRASDDVYVSTLTSNDDGVAESGLMDADNYYWLEKTAPNGYLVDTEKHYFTVTPGDDEFAELTANDIAVKGKATITKEDPVSGTRPQGDASLDGAIYGLYASEDVLDPSGDGSILYRKDQEVARRTIANNTATVDGLPLSLYYWKEISAPTGYNLDSTKYPINLRYQDQDTAVVETNTLAKDTVKEQAFQIIKLETPSGNGQAPTLSGAGFTYILKRYVDQYGFDEAVAIAKSNDGRILPSEWGYMETDDKGYALSKNIPYGTYTVRETKIPADHKPVADFEVIIDEHSPDKPQYYRFFIDETLETELALVKEDAETGKVIRLPGMKFKVKALTDTADFKAGDYVKFRISYPLPHTVDEWETTDQGVVVLEKSLKAGTYQIEELRAPNGYLLETEPLIFTIKEGWNQVTDPDDESIIITVVHFQDKAVKGQVKIDKQAQIFKGYTSEMTEYGELFTPIYETGRLANVKFEIKAEQDIIGADGTVWYQKGEVVETMVTDGETIATSSLLPLGTEDHNLYSVREIETEEGYVVDDTVRYFRFDYVDQNTPIVTPTWLDENGDEIEVDEAITIENEKQTALAVANKELEESETNDTSNVYQNVVFGMYTSNVNGLESDSLVGIGSLNDDNQLGIALSQEGDYYLREMATDPLYQLDENKYPITYAYNGDQLQTITVNDDKPIVNYLKRATIEIIKYTDDDLYYSTQEQSKLDKLGNMDEYMRDDRLDERNYLAFAEFELSTDKDFTNIICTGTTDIDGRLVFDGLELGTYFVREKGSADFYEINDVVYEITLSKHAQFETIEVENNLMTSYVNIKKVDSGNINRVLPFAQFTMYADEECTKEIETITTGIDGIARFNDIKFGTTVYIKEMFAPVGYEISDEIIEVTINEDWVLNTKDKTIVFKNTMIPETPNTGSDITVMPYAMLLVISIVPLAFVFKRKKSEE